MDSDAPRLRVGAVEAMQAAAEEFCDFMTQFVCVAPDGIRCWDLVEAGRRYVEDHPEKAALALAFFTGAWAEEALGPDATR